MCCYGVELTVLANMYRPAVLLPSPPHPTTTMPLQLGKKYKTTQLPPALPPTPAQRVTHRRKLTKIWTKKSAKTFADFLDKAQICDGHCV